MLIVLFILCVRVILNIWICTTSLKVQNSENGVLYRGTEILGSGVLPSMGTGNWLVRGACAFYCCVVFLTLQSGLFAAAVCIDFAF